jgi:hypothetical protein
MPASNFEKKKKNEILVGVEELHNIVKGQSS